jgi:glycosyltransferase involved in cell wall biosynthesis
MTGDAVGVVVPAYRETEALAATLGSLLQLDHPGDVVVVVAVDGGDQGTVAVAEEFGVIVVPVRPNGGSYAARNAGLDALPAGLSAVLFTDADCVVPPHWVTAHLRALRECDLSGGAVRFRFARERPSPAEWVDACRHLKQQVYVERDGFAATCNLAVRAEVVREQRFDATLRTGGDAEFCRRIGGRLCYTEDAWIEHPARNFRELRAKVSRLAAGVPGQASRWLDRELPSARLTRGVWRRARVAGHDVGPAWGVTACLLDWALTLQVRRAVHKLPGRAT